LGLLVQRVLVEEQAKAAPRLAADVDVLRRAQVVHQVQFLMHDADAQRLRGAWRRQLDRLAVEQDVAGVALVNTRQHLHQRAPRPCAVRTGSGRAPARH
jgi:hypothetical protein